ncbi:hypothetical protein, partial [Oceanispirochaeta sp.]|uniref:hypothetical protein n=1 Tax=Oceanispirochaeta sp. TaxID=2035350 RepID=UPI00261AF3C4
MKRIILSGIILALITSCDPISLKTTIDDMVLGWTRELVYTGPEDGAGVADKTPLLDWEDAGGATGYELQIVEAVDQFEDAPVIEVTESQYEIPAGLIICDARFWRVRAVKTGEPGPWSESRS